jgi:hypothetical protein
MIRPAAFSPNPQTAADNAFQRADGRGDVAASAFEEVTRVAETLREEGVVVHLFDDGDAGRPDSVFPNNWISTHQGGRIALFPMYAPNRRTERRSDIVEMLKERYRVQEVIDYSGLERDGLFLEGTGAMVLDHDARIAYAARSRRADPVILERFCTHFGYEPMVFDAVDASGLPVYHTNVMMCIAADFALVALELIADPRRREETVERLRARGRRTVIPLTSAQVSEFAGNAMELQDAAGERLLALSVRARAALTPEQADAIESTHRLVPLAVPTIELAGGSVRCMLAGVHLDARPGASGA